MNRLAHEQHVVVLSVVRIVLRIIGSSFSSGTAPLIIMSEYFRDPHSQALLAPPASEYQQLENSLHETNAQVARLKQALTALLGLIRGTPNASLSIRDIEEML